VLALPLGVGKENVTTDGELGAGTLANERPGGFKSVGCSTLSEPCGSAQGGRVATTTQESRAKGYGAKLWFLFYMTCFRSTGPTFSRVRLCY
jgi:hypothetical protein